MLNVSTDTIQRLVDLAKEFHAQEAVSFPEDPADPDLGGDWSQILASHATDATYQEFRSIILDLDPDQQQDVVALLWLGRGDFEEEEWQEALEQARDEWNLRTADYLIAHPLLPDYLEEGLDILGYELDH